MIKNTPRRVFLDEKSLPKQWYNIAADMPNKIHPYLNPVTKQPAQPSDLSAIFPMALIEQEMSTERFIDIPEELQEMYKVFRPSPLVRAKDLEKALDTPARIYFKYEGANTSGSHKLNTAMAQAYYNKKEGIKKLTTETGAGQWGSALSIACAKLGMECTVFMVRVSYDQKPYRKILMRTYGADIYSSPSNVTEVGKAILAKDPDCSGSLAIAISEAVEVAAKNSDTNYSLGSVLNHVILHQTIIGQEAKKQFEVMDDYPDIIIGCNGGGSNFGGIAYPFMMDKLRDNKEIEFIAIEPTACPKLTKGVFAYDYGDMSMFTPLMKTYTLGHEYMPDGIHAGGLRYHGDSPLLGQLYHDKLIKAEAKDQVDVFDSAILFARTEGILPAPESAHAIASVIAHAKELKERGEAKTILFNLSGHGDFDLAAYEEYMAGKLKKINYTDEQLHSGLSSIPKL